MVRSGAVVTQGFRAIAPDEHRAGMADAREYRLRVGQHQLQMLGRQTVDQVDDRFALGLQFGDARAPVAASARDPARNADNLKAAAYWLGVDAAGLCAVPVGAGVAGEAVDNLYTKVQYGIISTK